MGYFAIPGISGLDLFSGTVFVSTDSTIAQTVNGVVLGIIVTYISKSKINPNHLLINLNYLLFDSEIILLFYSNWNAIYN